MFGGISLEIRVDGKHLPSETAEDLRAIQRYIEDLLDWDSHKPQLPSNGAMSGEKRAPVSPPEQEIDFKDGSLSTATPSIGEQGPSPPRIVFGRPIPTGTPTSEIVVRALQALGGGPAKIKLITEVALGFEDFNPTGDPQDILYKALMRSSQVEKLPGPLYRLNNSFEQYATAELMPHPLPGRTLSPTGLSQADYVEEALRLFGRPARASEIVPLLSPDFAVNSKYSLEAIVAGILNAGKRFVRVDRGVYALRDGFEKSDNYPLAPRQGGHYEDLFRADEDVSKRIRREFLFEGQRIADPDPTMSIEEVKQTLARAVNGFPLLINSSVTGPILEEGKYIYEFKPTVGTHG